MTPAPRWKYLTRSYVEALCLPDIVLLRRRSYRVGFIGENECLPKPGPSPYVRGTEFEGFLFEMEEGGRSYAHR